MALIPCHECKREISSDAVKCPHCGATKPIVASMQMFYLVAVALAAVVALIAMATGG